MDKQVGERLQQLEEDGLADNTIVFFFSDQGLGIPRCKRTLYDSGLHVPLLIRAPEKYQKALGMKPGQAVERMVSFVDFAPTILSLVGLPIPQYMQGSAFLGEQTGPAPDYTFGASSRVDEAYEISRSVRDKRYEYIRNYMPHLPYIQTSFYPDQASIMKELRRLNEEKKLSGPAAFMMGPTKPIEELYDTETDPHEIH